MGTPARCTPMNDQGVCIRPMTLADVDGVLYVEVQSFLTPWSRAAFEAEIRENDLAHYFVAVSGKQIIGYAGMWIIVDEVHVTNVAVLPEHRGCGLGKRLMETMVGHGKKHGAVSMTLEVRISNTIARCLYEGMRFEPRGIRPNYYTDTQEDAIIMWRDPL